MGSAVASKSEDKKTKAAVRQASPCEDQPKSLLGGAGAGMPLFMGGGCGCPNCKARGIQAKLVVGDSGDAYERQADRVADAASGGHKHRKPFPRMATPAPPAPGSKIPAADSGMPLSPGVRKRVEPALGADLSHVRVHSNPQDRAVARSFGARAFTHGQHIWLGPSQSSSDVKLMAHESAHVVQQGAAPGKTPAVQRLAEGPDGPAEEASSARGPDPAINAMMKDVPKGKPDSTKKKEKPDPEEVKKKRGEVMSAGQPAASRATKNLPRLANNARAAKAESARPAQPERAMKGGKGAKGKGKGDKGKKGKGKAGKGGKGLITKGPTPVMPAPVQAPKIAAPVDAAGKPLAPDPRGDAAIGKLVAMAQVMRLQGFTLRQRAAQERHNAGIIQANMTKVQHGIDQAGEGIGKSEEHLAYRREVVGKAEGALHISEQKAEAVASGAPKYQSTAAEGKGKSGPMSSEAHGLSSENSANQPDDDDAAENSKEQGEKLGSVGSDIGSMDDAMTQTKAKADTLAADAAGAKQKNTKTQANIASTHGSLDQTHAKITQMHGQNAAAQAKLTAHASGPAQQAAGAARLDAQGQAAIKASNEMEQRAHAAQAAYLAGMRAVPAKKRKKQPAGGGAPTLIQRKPDDWHDPDGRINLNLGGKTAEALPSWLTGEEKKSDEERAKADAAEKKRRADEIAEINAKAGGDFSKLSAADKAGIALELTGRHLFGSVAGISWPNFLGKMLQGLVDPRMALMGVVSGLSMTLSGVANLFSLEQWKKDPLGNLLKSAADIATGITIVLGSITALAIAIIAILVLAAIFSFGALGPVAAAVIPFCGTVVSTVGPWTITAAAIALELNVLLMIKDLVDAACADTAEKLQSQSDKVTDDAKTAGNMALQIGMAAVGEAGGEALANTKFGAVVSAEMRGIGEDFGIVKPGGGGAAPPVGEGAAPVSEGAGVPKGEAAPAPKAETAPAPKGESPAPSGEPGTAPKGETPAPKGEPAAAPKGDPAAAPKGEPAAAPKGETPAPKGEPAAAPKGEQAPGKGEPAAPEGKPADPAAAKPGEESPIAADAPAPEGHTVKVRENGACEVCSPGPCPSLKETVEGEIATDEIPPTEKAKIREDLEAVNETADPKAKAQEAAKVLDEAHEAVGKAKAKAAAKSGTPEAEPGAPPKTGEEAPAPKAKKGGKAGEEPGAGEQKPAGPEEKPVKPGDEEPAPKEEEPAPGEPESPAKKSGDDELRDRLEKVKQRRAEQQKEINDLNKEAVEAGKKLNELYEKQKVTSGAEREQVMKDYNKAKAKLKEANARKANAAAEQDKILEAEANINKALEEGAKRQKYMGSTPGKFSKQGLEVQAKMRAAGKLRTDPVTGETEFMASDKNWYPLEEADMAHFPVDAVKWWNQTGRQYGAKAPEVRAWMLDSKNYVLDQFSLNRSAGAQLGIEYEPPLK